MNIIKLNKEFRRNEKNRRKAISQFVSKQSKILRETPLESKRFNKIMKILEDGVENRIKKLNEFKNKHNEKINKMIE